jgi:hypothetical protein
MILSDRKLIRGLYEGLTGVCEGERLTINIPSDWAFGDSGHLAVPGGAKVTFDIHVTGVEPHVDVFHEIDANGDNCLTVGEIAGWLRGQNVAERQLDAVAARMFSHDNENDDDFITCDEFSGPTVCDFHEPAYCVAKWAAFDEVVNAGDVEFNEESE